MNSLYSRGGSSAPPRGRAYIQRMSMTRRDWLRAAAGSVVASLVAKSVARALGAPPAFTVYKTPTCGCCKDWVKHVTANGYKPVVHDLEDLTRIKADLGVPSALTSCHTAVVGRYVIEGHVPADLIKKLIAESPPKIAGLAVPGMIQGSPGMETGRKEPYDVIAFTVDGKTSVYARR